MQHLITLLLCFCFFLTPLAAQQAVDRPAELPPGSVRVGKQAKTDDGPTRLLTAVYSTIRYPKVSREAGLMGGVAIQLHVDEHGQLTVSDAQFHTLEETISIYGELPTDQLIQVIGYSSSGTVPALTRSAKRRTRAETALVKEVVRTFEHLPAFNPAVHDGQAVASELLYVVSFMLE